MRRRDFVTLLSGAAVAWPIAAQAQQPERTRRIGLLAPYNDDRDTRVQAYLPAFKQRLHELGWIEGRNIRFDYRFTGQDAERIRVGAEELIALAPDIIVVWANPAAAILRRATQTIPIVFTQYQIRLGVVSWRTWRIRAEISPASKILRPRSAGNGWKCLRRSRLRCGE